VQFDNGTKAGEYVIDLTAAAGVHNDSDEVTIAVENQMSARSLARLPRRLLPGAMLHGR